MLLRLRHVRTSKFDVNYVSSASPNHLGMLLCILPKNKRYFMCIFSLVRVIFHIKSLEKKLEICYNMLRGKVRPVGELRIVPKIQHNMEDIL